MIILDLIQRLVFTYLIHTTGKEVGMNPGKIDNNATFIKLVKAAEELILKGV